MNNLRLKKCNKHHNLNDDYNVISSKRGACYEISPSPSIYSNKDKSGFQVGKNFITDPFIENKSAVLNLM